MAPLVRPPVNSVPGSPNSRGPIEGRGQLERAGRFVDIQTTPLLSCMLLLLK